MSPDHGKPGNGLLLFFRVDDFDLALQRARSLVTRLEEEPHVNPNTQTREFSLGIRTVIALRSVRSLHPDTTLAAAAHWPGLHWGQRRPDLVPLAGGLGRLIAHSIMERIAEFRF